MIQGDDDQATRVLKQQLLDILGGVQHEVHVRRTVGMIGHETPLPAPVVQMWNDDDPHYVQTFKNRPQLDLFIARLLAARDQAWPEST